MYSAWYRPGITDSRIDFQAPSQDPSIGNLQDYLLRNGFPCACDGGCTLDQSALKFRVTLGNNLFNKFVDGQSLLLVPKVKLRAIGGQ